MNELETDEVAEDEEATGDEVVEVTGEDENDYGLPSRALIIVATEGEVTADGRVADVGGLTWRTPPLSLTVNHDPDQRVGRLDRIARVQSVDGLTVEDVDDMEGDGEGSIIVATATLNLDTELGRTVAAEIRDGFLTGVSMEVGDEVVEWDENDVMHLVEARIGAVSVVVFQAIETARVVEVASAHRWMLSLFPFESESLVAAGVLDVPPGVWFTDPEFDGPTGMIVTDTGQVYGHLAVWGTCHTGKPEGVCVTAPTSQSGYAYFATGYVKATADGGTVDVPVGVITMDTSHASVAPNVSAQAAAAHYDNTGTAVADVAVGEDEHGIWFAGALRPGVTAEQVRRLRASGLSGDWRSIRGSLELVAALAVNVPGFPVPRVQAGLAASGEQVSLVAAGTGVDTGCGCNDTTLDDRVARLERTVSVLARYTGAVERLAARIK